MQVKVNEMRENTVASNGEKTPDFSIYYSGESFVTDTPYEQQKKTQVEFEAEIIYQFEWQYDYDNTKGNFIQSFSKFSFVLVFLYCLVLICKFWVRSQFYKELNETIRKTDQEVHMQAGVIPQSGAQGRHSRFAHLLSFETIYRNSQHIEKFEHKFLKSEHAKKTMKV
jgi:hypothetical protein